MVGLTVAQAQDGGGSYDDLAGLTPCGSKGSPPDIPESASGVAEPHFQQTSSSQILTPSPLFTLSASHSHLCALLPGHPDTEEPAGGRTSRHPSHTASGTQEAGGVGVGAAGFPRGGGAPGRSPRLTAGLSLISLCAISPHMAEG